MSEIINITINRYKRAIYYKKKFFLMLFIPIIAAIIGVMANSLNSSSLNIGIITKDTQLLESLNTITNVRTKALENKDSTTTDLIMGKYDVIISINDENYSVTNIRSIKNINIDKLLNDAQNHNTQNRILADYESTKKLTAMTKTISFLMLMLFITCTLNASVIIQDKKHGILDRIKTSSSKSINYIFGNVLYNFTLTLCQTTICLVLAKLLKMAENISFIQLILVGLSLSLLATTFGTLMGIIFNNDLYSNLTASLVSLLLSLFGGTFIAFENMPIGLQKIGSLSPTRWFVLMTSESGTIIIPYIIYSLIFSCILIISCMLKLIPKLL